MGVIFLSHSNMNNAVAIEVRDWLNDQGWSKIFVDIDPRAGLAPGQRWRQELQRAGHDCEAVILLVTPEWAASKWCLAEFLLAYQLGKQVFPLLIKPTERRDLPEELFEFQFIDFSSFPNHQDALNVLAIGLQRAGVDPHHFKWPPPEDRRRLPYRGLEIYEKLDAGIFFGREGFIARALDTIRAMPQSGARVLVILGASGAGKSSFLHAGVLARLQRLHAEFVVYPTLRPGKGPLHGEAGLFARLSSHDDDHSFVGSSKILAVDQAEEIFQASPDIITEFWTHFAEAMAADAKLLAIFTIRSDSYHLLQVQPKFSSLEKIIIDLPPIARHVWPDLITKPAEVAGHAHAFSDALVEKLIADHESSATLPLLSYTLKQLYLASGQTGSIGVDQYEALGGLRGMLDRQIDRVLREWARQNETPAKVDHDVRELFIPWLVTTDPVTGQPRRRTSSWNDIPTSQRELADILINERLLVSSGDGTVEVAHEALFEAWSPLRVILTAELNDLSLATKFVSDAEEWKQSGLAHENLAYRGARFENIIMLLQKAPTFVYAREDLCAHYLWECWKNDFSSLRRLKYTLLLIWVFVVAIGNLKLR